ncbi:MAG TPA: hypothetical protein DCM38_08195 [Gammaproteobacteria bacterium]|nr:hypothetical protein [Gammaproteobacteria bacterium]
MVKVLMLVEGQTEEKFIKKLLGPHLHHFGVYPVVILLTTKRVKNGTNFKGGIVSYTKIKQHLQQLFNDSSAIAITTLFDYYGLPKDFPGLKSIIKSDCYQHVESVESAFNADINERRFMPYLQLHEFESLLFSSPVSIAAPFEDEKTGQYRQLVKALENIRNRFKTPEEINNRPETCPHRQIENLIPSYRKVFHGVMITSKIGLKTIREECSHFDKWVTQLEALGELETGLG